MYKDPILCHFDLNKQCFIETDFLDYINASVLLQMYENSLLHLVAYFLRRMAPVKCNYKIYDKKLLAIICCFEEWKPELEGIRLPVKVLTDHKGLEYFMTTKKLTPRQVRWTEFLSEFNFVISYQSGKKNDKADALTRKPDEQPINDKNKQRKHNIRMLLPPSCIRSTELQPIEKSEEDHANRIDSDIDSETSDKTSPLPEQVMKSNQSNELCIKIHLYLVNPKWLDKPNAYLKDLKVKNKLLMKENWLWVADGD